MLLLVFMPVNYFQWKKEWSQTQMTKIWFSTVWLHLFTESAYSAMNFFWCELYSKRFSLRDYLQKFFTLHKARSVYLWVWCRMLVEIELLPRGWPNGVPSMPKNLNKKVQIYPNLVITLLEVNRLLLETTDYGRPERK